MYVGEGGGGFYPEVVCTHTALWTYVVWSNIHTHVDVLHILMSGCV